MKEKTMFGKKIFTHFFMIACFLIVLSSIGQKVYGQIIPTITSPDGKVKLVTEATSCGCGERFYGVMYQGNYVTSIKEKFGLSIEGYGNIPKKNSNYTVTTNSVDESYNLPVGKSKVVRNQYNELIMTYPPNQYLEPYEVPKFPHVFKVIFRVYNEGVAIRYVIEKQFAEPLNVMGELTEFVLPSGSVNIWATIGQSFNGNYELKYEKFTQFNNAQLQSAFAIPLPFVFSLASPQVSVAITEANLADYAGAYLRSVVGGTTSRTFKTVLPPWKDLLTGQVSNDGISVKWASETMIHETPWRVIMIGATPLSLIESNLIVNLNSSPSLDYAWVASGMVSWEWWAERGVVGVPLTLNLVKQYIDLAASYGWKYMLVDGGWYQLSNITQPIPELDINGNGNIEEIIEYANQKGVGVLLWLDCAHLYKYGVESAFSTYQQWGVKGLKVDFKTGDDQGMVGFHRDILLKAAQKQLLIGFHGTYKPTGERRTFPNLMTSEAVIGHEYLLTGNDPFGSNYGKQEYAKYNLIIPFTRMLAGPMDFTPGGFNHVQPASFTTAPYAPSVPSTRAYQLAMFVVYESYWQHPCDRADRYMNEFNTPSGSFLRQVPTTWDETRAIAGEIGEYVIIARRKGNKWYLGAMTNDQSRTISIPLNFLGSGNFNAALYFDGAQMSQINYSNISVTANSSITLPMSANGGACVIFEPRTIIREESAEISMRTAQNTAQEDKLHQNYPNPFNPATVISYNLKNQEYVDLEVYDLLGRVVAKLVSEVKSVGKHQANFDASKLPSGTYFYKIKTNSFTETRKMFLAK